MSLTLVVDTYAWIEYFAANPAFKDAIEQNTLITPSSVVAEISRSLYRRGFSEKTVEKQLSIVKGMSLIAELDFDHAAAAGRLAEKHKLHFADALVYSFADDDNLLLTGDKHFSSLPNVKYIK